MKKHEVTLEELNNWLKDEKYRWRKFAGSHGTGSDKALEVSGSLFKVTDHGREIYIGSIRETAIREYNAAP